MFNVFQQPWTLLTTAAIFLLITLMSRKISPAAAARYQRKLLVAAGSLAVAAFGFDLLVQTDFEKINTVIKTGIKAFEEKNFDAINAIIWPDYNDSYHNSKEDLMYFCKALLQEPLVEDNITTSLHVELSGPGAVAVVGLLTRFDRQSFVYKSSKKIMLSKTRLNLCKNRDKKWFIRQAEVLEIDNQPINWEKIR